MGLNFVKRGPRWELKQTQGKSLCHGSEYYDLGIKATNQVANAELQPLIDYMGLWNDRMIQSAAVLMSDPAITTLMLLKEHLSNDPRLLSSSAT